MSKTLPNELWLRVMDFIPDHIIFKLSPVNDLFCHVALDRRHRALTLDTPFPYELNRLISGFLNDPPIAARVRSLQINPMAVYAACCMPITPRRARLWPVKNPHWPETFRKRAESNTMIEDVSIAENLLDVFAVLTNLNSYTIAWSHTSDPLPTFATSFLSAVWSVLSTTTALHSLTLDMPFHDVCQVFSVTPFNSPTYLTALSLKFGNDSPELEHSLADLPSFLNVLSPCLRSLSLYVIGHFDLSIFFATLKHFSLLTDLSLSLPCDPGHLSDTQGFAAFLNAHKTQLKSLVFSPHFCCGPRGAKNPKSTSQESSTWECHAFSTLSFPALHSLELRLNPFGTRDDYVLNTPPKFTAAVAREKLTGREILKGEDIDKDPVPLTLSILGRLILLDDLKILLSPFSLKSDEDPQHRITSIRVPESLILETHILSPNLLYLLSSSLPRLKSLNLTYTWIGELGCDNERNFVKYLRKRTYPHWHLRNFTLNSTTHEDARRRCERAIRKAVPSLDGGPVKDHVT